MAWDYKREEQKFELLPEGRYRIRIKSAEKAMSSKGNDMLALQFEVSNSRKILYHYITFLNDRPEITNRMLTQFFDSFAGIPEGDFNMTNWIGKTGACMIKHQEDQNGDLRERISYFVKFGKYDDLPDWVDADGRAPLKTDEKGFVEVPDDLDLPF